MISDAPHSRSSAGVDDELGADDSSWFAAEVPDIVEGLASSQSIGPLTAAAARQLIAVGRARDALALVLGEVDGSWRR
ncbi:harpin-binding protein [Haloferax chudinovii]|uniref:Harpin-binding protein n=1 Tax=Haloferax chudinovii TaxID=1109010 RepID=A0ABD5XHV7_9EURY